METGDGRSTDSAGLTRNEENVIRLPRDWLGPPEELVPIGPAARARAAQRDRENAMPPAADAFWSEDSAALHDAVQAPSGPPRGRLDPPVGLVPPVAGLQIPGLNRLRRIPSLGRDRRVSRWWSLAAVPVVALLVAATIGSTQGPRSHPGASHGAPSHALAASTVNSVAASDDAAADKFQALLNERQSLTAALREHRTARSHSRAHARANRPVKPRHSTPAHHSTGTSAPTVTQGAASPQTSRSSAPVSTSAASSASTESTSNSQGSNPATGPPGPIGIGSISGGCSVKCS